MKQVAVTLAVLSIMLVSLGSIWITYKRDKERERRRKDDVD